MMRRLSSGLYLGERGGLATLGRFAPSSKETRKFHAFWRHSRFLSSVSYAGSGLVSTRFQGLSISASSSPSFDVQKRGYSFSHRPSNSSRSSALKNKERNTKLEENSEDTSVSNFEEEDTSLSSNTSAADSPAENNSSEDGEETNVDLFQNVRHHSFLRDLVQKIQTEMPATRSAYETYSKDVVNTYIRPLLQLVDKAFTVDQLHQLAKKINPSVLKDTLRTETAQRAYHVFLSTKSSTILDWSAEDFLRRRYESIHLSWEPMDVVMKRFNWSTETMSDSDILVYFSKFDHLIELARMETINGKPKALPIRNPLELARRRGISPSLLLIRRTPGESTEPSLTESVRLMGTPSLTAPSSKGSRSRRTAAKNSVPDVFSAVEEAVGEDLGSSSAAKLRRALDKVTPTRQAHHPAGRTIREFSVGHRDAATASTTSQSDASSVFARGTSASTVGTPNTLRSADVRARREEVEDEESTTSNTDFNQYEFDNLCGQYHRRKVEISLIRRRLTNVTSSDQSTMLQDRLTNAKKELAAVGEQLKVLRALKDQTRPSKRSASRSAAATVTASTTAASPKAFRYKETREQEKSDLAHSATSLRQSSNPAEISTAATIPSESSRPKNYSAAVDQDEEAIIEEVEVEDELGAQGSDNEEGVEEEVEEVCLSPSTTLAEELSDVPPSSAAFSSASPDDEEARMECESGTSEKESAAAELAAFAAKEFEEDALEQQAQEEDALLQKHRDHVSKIQRQAAAAAARAVRVWEEETEDYDTMQELEKAEEELERNVASSLPAPPVEEVSATDMLEEAAYPLENSADEVGEKVHRKSSSLRGTSLREAEEEDVENERCVVEQLAREEEKLQNKMKKTKEMLENTTKVWMALESRMKEALELHTDRLQQFEREIQSIRDREERVRSVEERLTKDEAEYNAFLAAEERAKTAEAKYQAEKEIARNAQEVAKRALERQREAEHAAQQLEKELREKEVAHASRVDEEVTHAKAPREVAFSTPTDAPHPTETIDAAQEEEEDDIEQEEEEEGDAMAAPSTTPLSASSSPVEEVLSTPEGQTTPESASAVEPLRTKRADSSYTVSDFMCTPEQYDGLHYAAKRLRREIAALEKEMEDGDAEDDETLMSVLAASRSDLEELEECITSVQHHADWAAGSDRHRAQSDAESTRSISPAMRELQEAVDGHSFNLALLEKRLYVATQRSVISKLEQGIVHARRELSRLRREQERLRRVEEAAALSGVREGVRPSATGNPSGEVHRNAVEGRTRVPTSSLSTTATSVGAADDVDEEVEMEEEEEGILNASRTSSTVGERVGRKGEADGAEDGEEAYAADGEGVEEVEEGGEINRFASSFSSVGGSESQEQHGEKELKSLDCFSELKEMTRDLFDDTEAHTDEALQGTSEREVEEEKEEMSYEEAVKLKSHLDAMVSDIQNLQRTILLQEKRNGRDEESMTVMQDLKEKEKQLLQIRNDVELRLQDGGHSAEEVMEAEEDVIPHRSTPVISLQAPHRSGIHTLSAPPTPLKSASSSIPPRRMGMTIKKRTYAR